MASSSELTSIDDTGCKQHTEHPYFILLKDVSHVDQVTLFLIVNYHVPL